VLRIHELEHGAAAEKGGETHFERRLRTEATSRIKGRRESG